MLSKGYVRSCAAGHRGGRLLPSVYQEDQLPACTNLDQLCSFRFYVIIFFFFPHSQPRQECMSCACVCVCACTLCKCRAFQTPDRRTNPNQLTTQVLILSAHKLLFLFLISNAHICADICFFISFVSGPREEM